jgi:hypothetical protein
MNGHDTRQAKGIEIGKVEKGRDKANRGARRRTLEEGEVEHTAAFTEPWMTDQTSRQTKAAIMVESRR